MEEKEFGEVVKQPSLPGTARVLARWPDGYEEHLQVVQLELWPEFKEVEAKASGSGGLRKNGSKKKKNTQQ